MFTQTCLALSLLSSITKHLLIELGQKGGIPHRIPLLSEHQRLPWMSVIELLGVKKYWKMSFGNGLLLLQC